MSNSKPDDHTSSKNPKNLFLIGEVSQICGISQRALRLYDELELIKPDRIGENGYRYYSYQTMLKIPVINYLKKMGFSLNEISEFSKADSLGSIYEALRSRSDACDEELRDLNEKCEIIRDWSDLISEAGYIIDVRPKEVSCRFLPEETFLSMPYLFWGDYADATINLEFTSLVQKLGNVISGPVIMGHSSYSERLEPLAEGETREVLMMQKALRPIEPEHCFVRPKGMYLSSYHVGSFDELGVAYERIFAYAEDYGYRMKGCSYERFVTDYWTTHDPMMFVAEVLLPIER